METGSLAVRYRPKTLRGLIGQDHIVAQVKGMIKTGKIPSAILLSGPTGLGKTTTARIIVRYLNCASPNKETFEPCGECQSCKMKSSPDVTELNAADSRGIDDVRALVALSKNMPSIGNKRVFIIDEAQQLPALSQQTLLKPIEEPPANTLWIICTMSPEKVIPAIAKRCLRLAVKPVSQELIVKRLAVIAKREGTDFKAIEGGDKVLKAIADLANGGVRDAISLLESVLLANAGNKDIDSKDVLKVFLNSPEAEADVVASKILIAVLGKDLKALLAQTQDCENIRGVLNKLRWLIDYLLSNAVGKTKFVPYSGRVFAKDSKTAGVKVSLQTLIMMQNLLVEVEYRLNSIAIEERVLFTSMVGNFICGLE